MRSRIFTASLLSYAQRRLPQSPTQKLCLNDSGTRVTIDVQNVPLEDVLRMLSSQFA